MTFIETIPPDEYRGEPEPALLEALTVGRPLAEA